MPHVYIDGSAGTTGLRIQARLQSRKDISLICLADSLRQDLKAQADNFILPMLGLQEGDYERFAASVSTLNVRSYGVAIVQPAEGKAEDVQAALENYVTSQQLAMENYLADQYEIAKAATVTTLPTGEVVLVCCEDSDAILDAIQEALAA